MIWAIDKRGSEPFLELEGPCSAFSGRDSRADHLSPKEGLVAVADCIGGSLCQSVVRIGKATGLWLASVADNTEP